MPARGTAAHRQPASRRAAGRLKRLIRSRLPGAARAAGRAPMPERARPHGAGHCLVCGSRKLRSQTVDHVRKGGKLNLIICQKCRYVSSPDAAHDYAAATTTSGLSGGSSPRLATEDRPGRETGMAKLGLEALQRPNASVLIYGAGQSLDFQHIAKLPLCGRVAIGDLVRLRDDAAFVDITKLSKDPFDVVVASEVLEHFPEPWENFKNLFSYVKDDGIIVAGTNIRD